MISKRVWPALKAVGFKRLAAALAELIRAN
jgi:hypothetical protein